MVTLITKANEQPTMSGMVNIPISPYGGAHANNGPISSLPIKPKAYDKLNNIVAITKFGMPSRVQTVVGATDPCEE